MLSQGVENSLESLEASAKAGASYSELDIILSKDGHFIVSHDDNLKRLTGKILRFLNLKLKISLV